MNKKKSISILGCGWLGLPLGRFLVAQGYQVKGSTTSESKLAEIKEAGIEPFLIEVTDQIAGDFARFAAPDDILIINFPPRRIPDIEEVYPRQLQAIAERLPQSQQVLFVSSTSVYPNINGTVTEDMELEPEKESGKALVKAEQLLQEHFGENTTMLRLAGLVGYDRLPGRFLANKKEVKGGDAPINVIHQDDCIGLIVKILELEKWGTVYNGCADKHPLRKDYYTRAAEKIGLEPPTFAPEEHTEFKQVSNKKSKQELGYQYKYPDPVQML